MIVLATYIDIEHGEKKRTEIDKERLG